MRASTQGWCLASVSVMTRCVAGTARYPPESEGEICLFGMSDDEEVPAEHVTYEALQSVGDLAIGSSFLPSLRYAAFRFACFLIDLFPAGCPLLKHSRIRRRCRPMKMMWRGLRRRTSYVRMGFILDTRLWCRPQKDMEQCREFRFQQLPRILYCLEPGKERRCIGHRGGTDISRV